MPGGCNWRLPLLSLVLVLVLLDLTCGASSLGLTVHVVPLDSSGGETVRAHFTAIAAGSCPSLSGLCSDGDDCLLHTTSLPFNGTKPGSGWCVRQWQKTVSSSYRANISLGSNTEFYVSVNAPPKVRANSGRLNQPAFVALPPPLRARVNCPHHFSLSVKDLDGDKVQCRFARPEQGECLNCEQHSFIELHKEKCILSFTGKAAAGQYFIYLMAEDLIPVPKISQVTNDSPLSSVPVHLSLTVEESSTSCSDEPLASTGTPAEDSVMFVLPYDLIKFNINYMSEEESVSEVAVVGPPELFRTGFTSVGPLAAMTVGWTRSENKLARLLPVCFVANTKSLQSEPRCVWLYQREMKALPTGTELKCGKSEMTLVLPVASLSEINLAELQLNSPTCPVSYNSTHLTATISLSGCGTKTVHSGNELVYTNTLHSVRPYTMVSRKPSLILPLACRIPGALIKGPQYQISMPTEKETFGEVQVWLEIHSPGEGPLSKFTADATFRTNNIYQGRVRREVESDIQRLITSNDTATSNITASTNTTSSAVGSRFEYLDLHVMSNCSVDRAEMIVSKCLESEKEDFINSHVIVEQGCVMSNESLEIITTQNNSKVYRLILKTLATTGTTMYVQCTVNLCIATMPSQKCPDLCNRSISHRTLVGSIFTSSYTIKSGPISLVVTTPAPTTVNTVAGTAEPETTTTVTTTTAASTSQAPEKASSMITAGILTTISIFLQKLVLH